MINKIKKTEEEWRQILTPEQYKVMREKGTEAPFSCQWKSKDLKNGIFHCAACDLPLFSSEAKFESRSGWPSYFSPIDSENLLEIEDDSFDMARTEVKCARCDSHLGHVFYDGPEPTGERYCINSIALKFKSKE